MPFNYDFNPENLSEFEMKLLPKRIGEYLEELCKKNLTDEEIRKRILRLKRVKNFAVDVLIEKLLCDDMDMQGLAIWGLKIFKGKMTVEKLKKEMERNDISDMQMMRIAAVLSEIGEEVYVEDIIQRIRNPEGLFNQTFKGILESCEDDEMLCYFVQEFDNNPPEMCIAFINDLKNSDDPRVERLLVGMLDSKNDDIVFAVIDALSSIKSSFAIEPLLYISEISQNSDIAKRASEVAFQLKMWKDNLKESYRETQIQKEPLYKSLMTNIDGAGGQMIIISRKRENGKLRTVGVFLTDTQGIRDCYGFGAMSEDDFDKLIKKAGYEEKLIIQDVPISLCQKVVSSAYKLTRKRKGKLPPQYYIWISILKQEGELIEDTKDIFNFEEIAKNKSLLQKSSELHRLKEFESWFFEPNEIFSVFFDNPLMFLSKKRQDIDNIVTMGLSRLFSPKRCELLRKRLLRQAEFLYYTNRKEQAEWAVAASLALDKSSKKLFIQNPVLRNMMSLTIKNILSVPFNLF